MIRISLQPEYVLNVFGFLVTNTFLTAFSVTVILSLLSLLFYALRHKNENKNVFLKMWHVVVYELLTLADNITQNRALSKKLLPLVATLFLFIVCTNLIALLPGFLGSFFITTGDGTFVPLFRSPNSDLTTTLALAIITVILIQYFSIRALGLGTYLKRFFNFTGVLPFVLGLFEFLSESLRVLSFSFRLFGNVFAWEVLLLVIAFLVPYILPIPFMILEVFIGLIQAYIFTILALTFIRISTASHLKRG
jgi:F-type H+-transporting ATPase subunit a